MIKYVCDYCKKEFDFREEYNDHQINCPNSPYQKNKKNTLYCHKIYYLLNGRYNYENEIKTVYDIIETHYEEPTFIDGIYTQGRTIKKENLNKIIISADLTDTMILRYYSLSNTNFSDIKQLFVEAIKNKIQEKIDKLNQTKNNISL